MKVVSSFSEIRRDCFYLYPSHDEPQLLLMRGDEILSLSQNYGEESFVGDVYMYSLLAGIRVGYLLQKHKPEVIRQFLCEDGESDFDFDRELLEAAKAEFGEDKVFQLKYGGEVHEFLNCVVMD